MAKVVGGCLCDSIRYRSEAEPALTAICHCTHCQRQSGSAFSVNVGVPRDGLAVEGATLATWRDAGDSGKAVLRRFCSQCGSVLFADAEAFPAMTFVKAGTLDDRSWVQPEFHIWCASAQPWVKIDPDAVSLPRNPPLP